MAPYVFARRIGARRIGSAETSQLARADQEANATVVRLPETRPLRRVVILIFEADIGVKCVIFLVIEQDAVILVLVVQIGFLVGETFQIVIYGGCLALYRGNAFVLVLVFAEIDGLLVKLGRIILVLVLIIAVIDVSETGFVLVLVFFIVERFLGLGLLLLVLFIIQRRRSLARLFGDDDDRIIDRAAFRADDRILLQIIEFGIAITADALFTKVGFGHRDTP